MASKRLCIPKRIIVGRLRDDGFKKISKRGSHEKWWRKTDNRTVTVQDKRDIQGDSVKNIWENAGWDWDERRLVQLSKTKKQKESGMSSPASNMVPSLRVVPAPKRAQKQENKVDREEAKVRRLKRLSPDTVELIATDLLERPDQNPKVFQQTWDISYPTVDNIRTANHGKLKDRTRLMLQVVFGELSVSSADELLVAYKAGEELPASVVRKIEALTPVHRRNTKEPEPQAKVAEPEVVPTPEPVAAPAPSAPALPESPRYDMQQAVAVMRQEIQVSGYAPREVGQTMVKIGDAEVTLKQLLEAVQPVMRHAGIKSVMVPDMGQIVIERREIL